jgi:hypothetical protein
MILNKTNVPYLTNEGVRFLDETGVDKVYNFVPHSHQDYWVVQFLHANDLTDENLKIAIPEEIRQKVRDKQVWLIFNNFLEAYHGVVEPIYQKAIIEMGLPEFYVYLFTHCMDIMGEVERVAKKYNKDLIRVAETRIYEYTVAAHEVGSIKSEPVDKLNKTFDKKFVFLNRRWRPHRAGAVAMLAAKDLLKYGHVSLATCEGRNWSNMFDYLKVLFKDTPEFIQTLEENEQKICSLPELYVDKNDQNQVMDWFTEDMKKFYNETYFSVVAETPFLSKHPDFDPGMHCSEKTYKIISQRHPFLMLGTQNTLCQLRNIGYKTFAPWIDESYDFVGDDGQRLLMVIKEIERLCNLQGEELNDFIKHTAEICEHNYQHLINGANTPGRYVLTKN